MIDRKKAIEELSKIKVKGGDNGLIEAFGVQVNFLPAFFWNGFTEKLLRATGNDDEKYKKVEVGLELAAAECGYHTGYGIITSQEFKGIVGPMIKDPQVDTLHGAFAVLTAWGWANSEIMEVSKNKMVVRAYNYYESEIQDVFKVTKPAAYMVKGICRAFMDLAYGATYPNGYKEHKCIQTKGIEVGDEYGEFVVTRV